MKRFAAAIAAAALCLSGCGNDDETYQPAYFSDESSSTGTLTPPEPVKSSASVVSSITANTSSVPETDSRDISLTPRKTYNELTLKTDGIYSNGKFYTVEVTGKKSADQTALPDDKTTFVNGVLYGDFRLKSSLNGEPTGILKLDIPRDDMFLVMDYITEDMTYGCEVISNYRQFGAEEYPDIIELDFYINGELEVPQYARYFAVLNGEIAEIPVYENGSPAKPLGTHLEPKSAGRMVQHLTVSSGAPNSYEIVKYEYIYDKENHRLNRKRVKFYGWEID